MVQQKFNVSKKKWMLRHLSAAALNGLVAALFWWLASVYTEGYSIVMAVLFSIATITLLGTALFGAPTLTIENGIAKFGRTVFSFADVINVFHKKDEYTFILSTRRRAVVKISDFSDADKKTIDRIFATECARYLTDESAREKIASASNFSQFEFSLDATRTQSFWVFYIFMTVYLILGVVTAAVIGVMQLMDNDLKIWTIAVAVGLLAVWGLLHWIEARSAKNTFSFKNDTFTLSRKGRVIWSFPREAVEGIGIAPQGKALISFRLKGEKKRRQLKLAQFGRTEKNFLKNIIRSVFFLPESGGGTASGIKNPFKI